MVDSVHGLWKWVTQGKERLGNRKAVLDVQRSLGLPGRGMKEEDYEAATQALGLKRELPPITEILARMRPERPVVRKKPQGKKPQGDEPQGNVGVSPEEAKALLASVGLQRSPLVKAIRGR